MQNKISQTDRTRVDHTNKQDFTPAEQTDTEIKRKTIRTTKARKCPYNVILLPFRL